MDFQQKLLFDGGFGTQLQARGLPGGALPELLNLTNPDLVLDIHRQYLQAGADILTTNTFGANRRKLGDAEKVAQVIQAGIRLARNAGASYVALDIGPSGALLEPFGTLSFSQAYDLFAEQVRLGTAAGADMVLIETMSDLLEAKAAVLAAKENCELPVAVTMTFGEDGRTFLGTTPDVAAATLCALGVDAVGINCSLGMKEMLPLVKQMLPYATVPVLVQPNAGLPIIENGQTTYAVRAEEFATFAQELLSMGVMMLGGCCGTTPAHIAALRTVMNDYPYRKVVATPQTVFTSAQSLVHAQGQIVVIGERINPTGKKKLKEALRRADYDYVLNEALSQAEAQADVLDVNVGLPELDEPVVLEALVGKIQAVCALPLQIDSADPVALERAARVYCGKPILNSVNGKEESLRAVLPIAHRYGAAVVALTLDENGIPERAEDRYAIAQRIVTRAEEMGIPRSDILVDCLVMTASTNPRSAMETLRAVRMVHEGLGCRTVLGVSNVSFGLPARETLNATYLTAALQAGLDMPILNPLSPAYQDVLAAMRVLRSEDVDAARYVERFSAKKSASAAQTNETALAEEIPALVLSGRKQLMTSAVRDALQKESAMQVVQHWLIPAIDAAGERFEAGTFFLPQLMRAAETVKIGFDYVRNHSHNSQLPSKGKILLATVKGDIHDIGKNIVKMLLENYGYEIVDLGYDVAPETVVETVLQQNIPLVGLSALMTTTVKGMQDTIASLRNSGATCKVMVGGAVLTEAYAQMVGADYYAKDAAEAARIAQQLLQ